MKLKIYNLAGQAVGEQELSAKVFEIKIKPEVVHEVFVAQTNNQRQPWADTKNRGEVSGGGKKPWPQKGTGRARHGSIRSPIWKGGGVAFGPLSERSYKTKINKKIRKLALKMCLSDKAQSGALILVENFSFETPKTKLFVQLLKVLPAKQKTFLVLTEGKDEAVLRITKNIKQVKTVRAEDVNVMDLLNRGAVITTPGGVNKLTEILTK